MLIILGKLCIYSGVTHVHQWYTCECSSQNKQTNYMTSSVSSEPTLTPCNCSYKKLEFMGMGCIKNSSNSIGPNRSVRILYFPPDLYCLVTIISTFASITWSVVEATKIPATVAKWFTQTGAEDHTCTLGRRPSSSKFCSTLSSPSTDSLRCFCWPIFWGSSFG